MPAHGWTVGELKILPVLNMPHVNAERKWIVVLIKMELTFIVGPKPTYLDAFKRGSNAVRRSKREI